MLADAPLQCWDNSTRGLDSATSIEFCKSLRMATEMGKSAAAVAIYQAPQSAYEVRQATFTSGLKQAMPIRMLICDLTSLAVRQGNNHLRGRTDILRGIRLSEELF